MSSPQPDESHQDRENWNTAEAVEAAISIVSQKDQPPHARLDAIGYIIEQFDAKYFPIFETLLNDEEEHPEVRSAAALAIGKVGGDDALTVLSKHTQGADVTVKNYAVQALGLLGNVEGIPMLLEALSDTNNTIFASAAEALGEIGRPAVPHLIKLLETPEGNIKDDVRCVAAWQLGQLRYSDAVPALVKAIREQSNPDVQALCIWALGEIGLQNTDVLEVLQWAKKHENIALSERAQRAIQKIARHLN